VPFALSPSPPSPPYPPTHPPTRQPAASPPAYPTPRLPFRRAWSSAARPPVAAHPANLPAGPISPPPSGRSGRPTLSTAPSSHYPLNRQVSPSTVLHSASSSSCPFTRPPLSAQPLAPPASCAGSCAGTPISLHSGRPRLPPCTHPPLGAQPLSSTRARHMLQSAPMAVSILLPQDPTSSQPAVLTPTPPHRARRPDRPMHTPRAPTDRHRPPHRRPPTARTQPHPPARPTDPPTRGTGGRTGARSLLPPGPDPPRTRRSFRAVP
jgi:hypothetical protein